MSADLARTLEERGIRLKKHHNGQYRASCPRCDRGPSDGALAVRIDSDGCTWCCHRCNLRGGIGAERNESGRRRSLLKRPDVQEPEQHRALAPWAREFWARCDLIERSTIAARYLVDHRGCMLPPFPAETHLRSHPNVKHASGWCGPALVALVSDTETAEPLTLHRTWLQPDGSGKAPIENPRLLLKGHPSRGVVRLWPDNEVTLGLALAEGIETALALLAPGLRRSGQRSAREISASSPSCRRSRA